MDASVLSSSDESSAFAVKVSASEVAPTACERASASSSSATTSTRIDSAEHDVASPHLSTASTESETASSSTFGVQSLEDALNSSALADTTDTASIASDPSSPAAERKRRKTGYNPVHPKIAATAQRIISGEPRMSSRQSFSSLPPTLLPSTPTTIAASIDDSEPLVPLGISPAPSGVSLATGKASSVRSLRLSSEDGDDDGDASSQAIASEEEEDTELGPLHMSSPEHELVMPRICMPARRPFTQRGKSMGHAKILVAGRAGVGKSALIRGMIQLCEDIVHVDPPPTARNERGEIVDVLNYPWTHTYRFQEYNASTRPIPNPATGREDPAGLHRRSSSGESVLERNICFIDSPGHQTSQEYHVVADLVRHVQQLMFKSVAFSSMDDDALIKLLSGSGASHVDLVIYMFEQGDLSGDILILSRLAALTNVLPIYGRSDEVSSPELLSQRKTAILEAVKAAGIDVFSLHTVPPPPIDTSQPNSPLPPPENPQSAPRLPYCISSAPGSDLEMMDASILMSPDYAQPLVTSDLQWLVRNLFEPDTLARLRHSSATKLVQWRKKRQPLSSPPPERPLTLAASQRRVTEPMLQSTMAKGRSGPSSSQVTLQASIDPLGSMWSRRQGSYLPNLNEEKAIFQALSIDERETWLIERLEECRLERTSLSLVQSSASASKMPLSISEVHKRQERDRHRQWRHINQQPLDIFGFPPLGARGRLVLKAFAGAGLAGAIVWCVLRELGWFSWDDLRLRQWFGTSTPTNVLMTTTMAWPSTSSSPPSLSSPLAHSPGPAPPSSSIIDTLDISEIVTSMTDLLDRSVRTAVRNAQTIIDEVLDAAGW